MEDAAGGILQRDALIGVGAYWRQKKFDYTGSDLIYLGCNATSGEGTDVGTWVVWKFSYTGTDVTTIEGPLTGAWDDRATLDWA
jgi:hypothetical protein